MPTIQFEFSQESYDLIMEAYDTPEEAILQNIDSIKYNAMGVLISRWRNSNMVPVEQQYSSFYTSLLETMFPTEQ